MYIVWRWCQGATLLHHWSNGRPSVEHFGTVTRVKALQRNKTNDLWTHLTNGQASTTIAHLFSTGNGELLSRTCGHLVTHGQVGREEGSIQESSHILPTIFLVPKCPEPTTKIIELIFLYDLNLEILFFFCFLFCFHAKEMAAIYCSIFKTGFFLIAPECVCD